MSLKCFKFTQKCSLMITLCPEKKCKFLVCADLLLIYRQELEEKVREFTERLEKEQAKVESFENAVKAKESEFEEVERKCLEAQVQNCALLMSLVIFQVHTRRVTKISRLTSFVEMW